MIKLLILLSFVASLSYSLVIEQDSQAENFGRGIWGRSQCTLHSGDSGPIAVILPLSIGGREGNSIVNHTFCLYYHELLSWRSIVINTLANNGILPTSSQEISQLFEVISAKLNTLGYPEEMVKGVDNTRLPSEFGSDSVSSVGAASAVLEAIFKANYSSHFQPSIATVQRAPGYTVRQRNASSVHRDSSVKHALPATAHIPRILFANNAKLAATISAYSNPVSITRNILQSYVHRHRKETEADAEPASHACAHMKPRSLFIVYQTRNVNTGGTAALDKLYKSLESILGKDQALLCDEGNHLSLQCADPPVHAIVITGEWCHEVLEDHGISEGHFHGRGIQYHLGFHHAGDVCAGHIAMTDSQYLAAYLHSRVQSAYYLGCPMTQLVEDHYAAVLMTPRSPGVAKEELIVIDPDLGNDYPPEVSLEYSVPPGVRVVMARGIPHEEMPLLLQRAKISLDLALPGPERLSGEAALFGAVPIVSSRWNGASGVDFPGVLRVDTQNGTALTEVIEYAFKNYKDIIQSERNSKFTAYIASLGERLKNTLDIVTASASLHFIMKPENVHEEKAAVYMAMAIFYLFPLASIDLYVEDPLWFRRHHYPFLNILKEGGLVREDPFVPRRSTPTDSVGFSFLRILSHTDATAALSLEGWFHLVPQWVCTPVLLSVKEGVASVFANADILLSHVRNSEERGILKGFALISEVSRDITKPFAWILPNTRDHACISGQDKNFIDMISSFFEQRGAEVDAEVILDSRYTRTLEAIRSCVRNEADTMGDIVDSLRESAGFQTVQSYYCNLVT